MTFKKTLLCAGIACVSLTLSNKSTAGEVCTSCYRNGIAVSNAHAPIGVMGDHMHEEGKWMLSYRYGHMDMDGNRIGTRRVTPEEIATTTPNRFASVMGQPPTLRIVATEMTMEMHMFGAMYGLSEDVTLMAMANYSKKSMDHITFAGGMGTTELGRFETNSQGWGDTKLGALIRLYDDAIHHVHLNAGLSLPTGSIDEEDQVLTPMGMTPTIRLPYAMQLGSGTYDFLPGLTYSGNLGKFGWGAQYIGEIRLEDENSEGYALGDKHALSAWGSYGWANWISTSLRFTGTTQDKIDGIDTSIVAPVQTADPDNYGGETFEVGLGVNLLGTEGVLKGQRFGIEATAPLYRDLNGPQMETDFRIQAGWQYAF